eukprot:gb/GEZJ01007469.1/.p1 GENE.gb/GEZJ01007469.1/~~gb/GEZJ01007469.1/.p1  ORF type:complete len:129 (+),score=7.83 gb/GEZJ01007469.1/:20-406(+)
MLLPRVLPQIFAAAALKSITRTRRRHPFHARALTPPPCFTLLFHVPPCSMRLLHTSTVFAYTLSTCNSSQPPSRIPSPPRYSHFGTQNTFPKSITLVNRSHPNLNQNNNAKTHPLPTSALPATLFSQP